MPFVKAAVEIFNVPLNEKVALVAFVNVGAAKAPPDTNKFPDVALSINEALYGAVDPVTMILLLFPIPPLSLKLLPVPPYLVPTTVPCHIPVPIVPTVAKLEAEVMFGCDAVIIVPVNEVTVTAVPVRIVAFNVPVDDTQVKLLSEESPTPVPDVDLETVI